MAHQCRVMRCTWQRCCAQPAAKMNQLWSFKSCYVVPSWGLEKWKAAFLNTDSFNLVVLGAVCSSGCMIECIQLSLWTEGWDGRTWLEHHWLFLCSLVIPALWNTFPRNSSPIQHLKSPVTEITLALQMRLRTTAHGCSSLTRHKHIADSLPCDANFCPSWEVAKQGGGAMCATSHLAPSYSKHGGLIA